MEEEDNSLKMKKKIFYLIHESTQGLSFNDLISTLDMPEEVLRSILSELEW